MRKALFVLVLLALSAQSALAHRLDEYLQATIFSISSGRVEATMRLVPGVAVADGVISRIDTDHDGVLSAAEQRTYAEQVLGDLQLKEDGRSLPLHLVKAAFPSVEQMRAGTGEITLSFFAQLPINNGSHKLLFENHHQSSRAVYLANSLVPGDETIHLGEQERNQNQSVYKVEFARAGDAANVAVNRSWSGFGEVFRLGVRHIAEGTDHLLFLITLLLPAPLLAAAGQWSRTAIVRQGLRHIVGVVSAFTLGHSITLGLAGIGVVHAPARNLELMIAISILISAVHALRPLLPGREAWIAASFGLIHGLAFASALTQLGVTGWYGVVSLLGFNLGIEAMQLTVVAVTLPALILLSRTQYYSIFRITGASLALIAALAWIVERTADKANAVAAAVEQCARHGVLLAVGLWALSAVAWWVEVRRRPLQQGLL